MPMARKCLRSIPHSPHKPTGIPRSIKVACMKRTDVIRREAQLRVHLELKDCRDKVFDVILIRDNVIFCARIKMRSWTRNRRNQALKSQSKIPPACVHSHRTLLEHKPAPLSMENVFLIDCIDLRCSFFFHYLFDRQRECHERQLIQGDVQQILDVNQWIATRCWQGRW